MSSKGGHRAKTRTKTRQSHLQTAAAAAAARGTNLLMTPARRRPSSEARLFELSSSSSFSSADSISQPNQSIISASRGHAHGGPIGTLSARSHKLARKFRSTQAINNVDASATVSAAASERRQRVYKQAAAAAATSHTTWTQPPPTANKSVDKRRRHLWPHQLVDDDNGGGGASTSSRPKQLARLVSSASRNMDDPTDERQSVSSFSPSESPSSSLSLSSASEPFVANHHSSQNHGKANSNTELYLHYRHSSAGSTPPPPATCSPISSSPSMFHNHLSHHLHRAGQYSSSQAHLQSLVTSDTTATMINNNNNSNNTNSMKRTTTTPTCNSTNNAAAVSRHHTRASSTQRAMAAANNSGSSQTAASQAQNNSTKPMTSSMLNNSGQQHANSTPASPTIGSPRFTLAQAHAAAAARLPAPAPGGFQTSHFANSQLPPPYSLAVPTTSGESQQATNTAVASNSAQSIFTFLNTGQQHHQASQQSHQQAASTTISYANNDQAPPQQQQPSVISNGVAIHNRPPQHHQQQFLMTGGHQPANFFGQTQAANANCALTSANNSATSKSKSCLACADISIKWYIVVIALLGLICALVGTIVGAVHSAGRDYISLSLLLIGVGLVLIAISWIALRITINTYKSASHSSASSLAARSPLVSPGSARRAAGCHTGLGSLGRPPPPPPGANRQPTHFGRPAPPLLAGRHAHHHHHHHQLFASHHQQALMHERLYMMAAAAAAAAASTTPAPVASSQRTTGLLASIKQRVPRCLVRLISSSTVDTTDPSDCPPQAPPSQASAMVDFLQRCHQSGHPLPAHLLFAPNGGAPPQMHLLAAAIAAANAAGLPASHAHHLQPHSLHPHDPLFRPPPPSYNAAMQDQRLRMIMQERASLQQQLQQAQAQQQQQQSVTDTPTQVPAPPPPSEASSSGIGQSPAPRPDTGPVSADSSSPRSAQTTTTTAIGADAPPPEDHVDRHPLDASQHAVTSENDIYVPSRTSPTVVNIGAGSVVHGPRTEASSGGANTRAEVKILGCDVT